MAAVEAGKVDIVIGTHRLLSRDVKFHDLGLLIVDEEQRFGVAHKERLKELKHNVDVLTLSATPIPRTLNMSLVGLRDMSVIETPPKDRLAIQTVVTPFSEALIRRAIEEELARKGQVFLVHNRVEIIYSLAALVKQLVPKARVVVGHGQMNEKELESVMLKFVRDEADVLCLHDDHRKRPRYPAGQHDCHQSCRPVRPLRVVSTCAGAWGVPTSAPMRTCLFRRTCRLRR